jgi:hypothetical protein
MHLRRCLILTAIVLSPLAQARADDKDEEIAKLRKENAELRKLLEKEREVARLQELVAREAERRARAAAEAEAAKARTALEAEAQNLKKAQAVLKAEADARRAATEEALKRAAAAADLSDARAKDTDLLRKRLAEALAEREKFFEEKDHLLKKSVNADLELRAARARAQQLLERIEELEKGGRAKPAQDVPPPPSGLRGRVEQVLADGLVKLNVGADAGLAAGQALEAARVDKDDPKKSRYVGKLKVVKVGAKDAVAKFEGGTKEKIMAGDEVFGRLESP